MKKTFCDKCGQECKPVESPTRFTFGKAVIHLTIPNAGDLCLDCVKETVTCGAATRPPDTRHDSGMHDLLRRKGFLAGRFQG